MARFAGIEVQLNVPCALRDGVVLFADIYRPNISSGEPLPTLLMRQPYGKALASTVTYAHPVWFANRGYMVIIQDVRGRGESEGVFDPFVQETADGFDSVEWAASFPGSSGKVGMYGFSYQGATQWAAAAARPPHLTAIAPAMTAADLYHGWFYPHGRFSIGGQLPWAAQLARDEARRRGLTEMEERLTEIMIAPGRLMRHLPLVDVEELGELAPYYRQWIEHPEYDGYWRDRDWLPALREECVPTLQIAGWYDPYLIGDLQTYAALRESHGGDSNRHQLIIGPWTHIPWGRHAGGRDHGESAMDAIHGRMADWFDQWLRPDEREDGLVNDGTSIPVRYFELGSNVWRDESASRSNSLFGASSKLTWYLTCDDEPANGSNGGGRLVTENVSSTGVDVLVYDARLPMPCESYLPQDRKAVQERSEILVYTASPFDETIHLAGTPLVRLRVDSLRGRTDVVAILTLVSPSGEARFLSVGRTLLDPACAVGEWVDIEIQMRPVAIACFAETAIRLEITGSAFPLFVRHLNGLEETRLIHADAAEMKMATIAIAHGGSCPSALHLPILDR